MSPTSTWPPAWHRKGSKKVENQNKSDIRHLQLGERRAGQFSELLIHSNSSTMFNFWVLVAFIETTWLLAVYFWCTLYFISLMTNRNLSAVLKIGLISCVFFPPWCCCSVQAVKPVSSKETLAFLSTIHFIDGWLERVTTRQRGLFCRQLINPRLLFRES